MPSITVKNIPPDLYERLKQSAAANRRSINSEIIACIERAVRHHPINVEEQLAQARHIRQNIAAYIASDEELNQAKSSGRP